MSPDRVPNVKQHLARSAIAALAWVCTFGTTLLPAQPEPQTPSTAPATGKTVRQTEKYKFDKDRLFLQDVTDFKRPPNIHEQKNEFDAYCELMAHAAKFPPQELEEQAASVTWLTLFNDSTRKDYRFELVKFEGRLKRIIEFTPPDALVALGVTKMYEAWIFTQNDDRPVCCLITELPEGVKPEANYAKARPATVAGYFFKIFLYDSTKKDPDNPQRNLVLRAPMLMARSLTVTTPQPVDEWKNGFIPGVLGGLALLTAAAIGMTWWFRSSDRRAQAALIRSRDSRFQPPETPGSLEEPKESPANANLDFHRRTGE